MNCYAIARVSRHRFAGALAVVAGAWLLLSTGGAALAQQGKRGGDDSPSAAELQQRAKQVESRAREAAGSAEAQAMQHRMQVEQLRARIIELQSQLTLRQQQLESARYELRQRHMSATPPPENSSVRIFRLQHARAGEVADMLHRVFGGGLRVAVDERLNTVVVLSDPKMSGPIEDLVTTLDSPPEGAPPGPEAERTLQLRILWLMDGLPDGVGTEPDERYVSPMVVDVLHDLGLEHPTIVCQQVSTLATSHDHRANFTFEVPAAIGNSAVEFAGGGQLSAVEGDRYRIELRIKVDLGDGRKTQMAGSLVAPLEHYVVLGTTNYVEPSDAGGHSFPMAFVVFLQEAPIAPR